MSDVGPRLQRWWEGLRPGRQARYAFPVIFVILLAVHVAFFHRITIARSVGYAFFEGLLATGLLVLATQGELARRRAAELPPAAVPPPTSSQSSTSTSSPRPGDDPNS